MHRNRSISKQNVFAYKVAFVASMGGFLFGFDLVVISGALSYLDEHFRLTPALKGFAVSSAILGAITGPLFGLWFADRLGRKKTLMISAVCFLISALGTAFAFTIWDFAWWRFLGGVGIGLAMMSSPIYISEISPPRMRGALVNVNQLSNVIGINLAVIACYLFSFEGWGWRWMFASEALPILFLMIGLFLIPESPRWLAAQSRVPEALQVLTKINGPENANSVLTEIRTELTRENGTFKELFLPGIRTALFIGIILMIFSQINGVNMILLYAPTILAEAGINMGSSAILSSIPVYVFIFICTLAAFGVIRKYSRRGLLMASVFFMFVGHIVMAVNLQLAWAPMLTLIPMLIGTGAFTLGFAPLSWIIVAEIYPNKLRSKALGIVCFFLYLASFLTAQFFPVMTNWFSTLYGNAAGVYWIFAAICAACLLFSYLMIPETKGMSLESISDFWRKKVALNQKSLINENRQLPLKQNM